MKKIKIVSWNLENLFHPETKGPYGDYGIEYGWTLDRYNLKLVKITDALKEIIQNGSVIIALSEIENFKVVGDLVKLLPNYIKIAKDKSLKEDYLDTTLLYDSRNFTLEDSTHLKTFLRFKKTDVTKVDLTHNDSKEKLTIFSCHLKARPRSKYHTSMYREAVCDNIQQLIFNMHGGDEILKSMRDNPEQDTPETLPYSPNVIILGDFNDEPFSKSIMDYLLATYDKTYVLNNNDIKTCSLYNTSFEGLSRENPGSYFYERSPYSNWSMLDQIIVSKNLINPKSKLKYIENSFRVISEYSKNEEGIPAKCSSFDDDNNRIIIDGYSDHFPISVDLDYLTN